MTSGSVTPAGPGPRSGTSTTSGPAGSTRSRRKRRSRSTRTRYTRSAWRTRATPRSSTYPRRTRRNPSRSASPTSTVSSPTSARQAPEPASAGVGWDSCASPPATIRGRLAFLTGQGPILNGTVVGGPIAEQTRVTLQNLAAILERLGADASAVVSCTCYLADLAGLGAFNVAHLEFFATTARRGQWCRRSSLGVEINAVVE